MTLSALQALGLLALVLLLLSLLYQVIYNHFFHPLSSYPGPFFAGVTRIWIAWHNYFEVETKVCWDLVQMHGPIVRVSPNLLLVAKAEYLPDIYHRRAVKTNHYNLLGFGRIASTFHSIKHEDHAHRRRMVANAYAFSNVKGLEDIIDARIQTWILRLIELFGEDFKSKSERDDSLEREKVLDLATWATFLTYDIMGEVAVGKDLECVKNGFDKVGLIKGFNAGLPAFGFATRMHVAAAWVNWSLMGRFFEWWVPKDNTVGVLMRYGKKCLEERLEELKSPGLNKHNDMLQRLLESCTPEGQLLPVPSIHAELTVILLAGADTISTAVCAIIIYVLQHPSSLNQILSEIKSARTTNRVTTIPKQSEVLEHFPYYVACVKESMRLCPSVQSIFPREVLPQHKLEIEGREIPVGTEVACNPWIIHRDREVYGDEAEAWRPERWLEENDGKKLEKYNLSLGYGSRVCLGRDLGMMELMKIPLMFLSTFEATLKVGENMRPPMKLRCRGGVASWENVWMKIREPEA